jgi:hypothetical protein
MQPIRQWLLENKIEQDNSTSELIDKDETILLFKKQWQKPFSK